MSGMARQRGAFGIIIFVWVCLLKALCGDKLLLFEVKS